MSGASGMGSPKQSLEGLCRGLEGASFLIHELSTSKLIVVVSQGN